MPDIASDVDLITLAEESALLRHYQEMVMSASVNLKLPRKVLNTSVNFLKRFYVRGQSLENDPHSIALTCLYLACKTEDCYLSAAELGRLVGMPPEIFLKLELVVLQGLDFDLQVFSPYRALEGCITDLTEWLETQNNNGIKLNPSQLNDLKIAAYKATDESLLSDAPLLFTPGQIGLSALRSGLKQQPEVEFSKYLDHVASKSGDSEDTNSENRGLIVAELLRVLEATDRVLKTSREALQDCNVVEIDRKLKSLRKKLIAAGIGGKKKG